MNELRNFDFEGKKVRTVMINNEPYFAGKDVATSLGYGEPSKAVRDHVNSEDKGRAKMDTPGGKQNIVLINESGIYDLIFDASRQGKNQLVRMRAKRFRHWVTSEVLPSIRKHGAYMTDQKAYDITHNPNGLADLLMQAGEQLKQKNLVIKELQPKALFADAVATSSTEILIGDLAKIIRGNGVDIGQNRLFAWMRENGYLINRYGSSRNMPTQKAMDRGLFKVKETSITHSDGHVTVNKTTKVTGKGQQYFVNKFLNAALV
ncbi:phage repressor protein/antirepressor Ant [Lactobacillus plantarum]|uniref:phage antirepressor n=1 Tax=Lactiplantibacillus plantarum TaxID=1590 RepID=UPI00143D31C7|nr:phage antirepressor KilAC domain-containing protein [Lactiplantibacillus plantarum]MBE1727427.1 phage antirepressor KilAC domain-containing protein [Lactiplantibacillus plantarum]NKI39424.1 phage repressor protein/antirepressor Ant [Lactiplantibacillus plantarum]